jgi:transposase
MEVLRKVQKGALTLRTASKVLGVSYRQVRRIYGRYKAQGSAGLRHGLRGRHSNHRAADGRRQRIVELYEAKYGDFGPTLAAEYLKKRDGESVGVETLRRWLMDAGLWRPRQRGAQHRKWRARKECVGEMVQMDGSEHDWFEGRRLKAVLMVMIDDATNRTYARFFEGETTAAAMEIFWGYSKCYGLPSSLYVDRDSIYETTRDATVDETLANTGALTQFGRAMKELDVDIILARSPQAKGRVERRNGVLQDRLVKALRLEGINTLKGGNQFLKEVFLPELNERFTVLPQQNVDLHRRIPRGVNLKHVLSYQEDRVVQNDWTVSWRNRKFQLTERHQKLSLAKRRIRVSELLDGTIRLVYRGRELEWFELPVQSTAKARRQTGPANGKRTTKKKSNRKPKPPANHPWRRKFLD